MSELARRRPFAAYEGNEAYVFVCYSHENRALVYPEITRLRKTGLNIWYDEGIAPGSEWSETLARQIKHCGTFLYYVTPQSVESEHCRREVNFALAERCNVVAVHLKHTKLPDGLSLSLSNRQGILKHEHRQSSYESKLDHALSANGSDTAGVKLRATDRRGNPSSFTTINLSLQGSPILTMPASVVTDANGIASFTLRSTLTVGKARLLASAPGHSTAAINFESR